MANAHRLAVKPAINRVRARPFIPLILVQGIEASRQQLLVAVVVPRLSAVLNSALPAMAVPIASAVQEVAYTVGEAGE